MRVTETTLMSDMKARATDRKAHRHVAKYTAEGMRRRWRGRVRVLISCLPHSYARAELLRLYRCLAEDDGRKTIMHLSGPAERERRRFSHG